MEWLNNCIKWVGENKDAIIAFVTSSQFVGFLTAIVYVVKKNKNTVENTKTTKALTENLTRVENMESNIVSVNEENQVIKQDITNITSSIANTVETLNILGQKVNAIIEAQQVVWSTIKDDNVRNNVNTILTNAKYKETSNVVQMREQIEELKKQVIDQANLMASNIAQLAEETKEVDEPEEVVVKRG